MQGQRQLCLGNKALAWSGAGQHQFRLGIISREGLSKHHYWVASDADENKWILPW